MPISGVSSSGAQYPISPLPNQGTAAFSFIAAARLAEMAGDLQEKADSLQAAHTKTGHTSSPLVTGALEIFIASNLADIAAILTQK